MTPPPKDNLTAVLYGINDLRLVSLLLSRCNTEKSKVFFKEQRPIPKPNDDRKCSVFRY